MDAAGQEPLAHSRAIPDEDQRWAAARSLAARPPRSPAERVSDGRAVLLLAALVIVAGVIGFGFALIVPRDEIDGSNGLARQREFLQIAAFALGVAGACTLFGGFIWASLTGRFATRWNSVLSPLTVAERRWAHTAVIRGTDAAPPRRPVLTHYAGQLRRSSLGTAPLYLAVAMVAVSAALVGDDPAIVALQYAVAVLALAGIVYLAVTYSRARRYERRFSSG